MVKRFCNNCGDEFEAKSKRIRYCRKKKTKSCPVCGKEIEYICNSSIPTTCSKSCAAKMPPKDLKRKCKLCGKEFEPKNGNQYYCDEVREVECPICGNRFDRRCTKHGDGTQSTCGNKDCVNKFKVKKTEEHYGATTKRCAICNDEFRPRTNTQRACDKEYHTIECKVCGKKFEQETWKILSGDYRATCSKECSNLLKSANNCMSDPDVRKKITDTYKRNHPGFDHPMHNPESIAKMKNTYMSRTGYDHPSHNPESRKRAAKKRKFSGLEQRICNLLETYGIEYVHHHVISNESVSHEFDFYIQKYKILMDADGVYFHSYLSDPDGVRVRDDYDDVRLALIPKDHIFILAVEGYEERHVKELHDVIKSIDDGVYDHDSEIFKWCREVGFPYPSYPEERMRSDFEKLKSKVNLDSYVRNCRYGNSIIQNFHKSIYHSRVRGNKMSPYEAWHDDKMLKKVIANRLVYKNDVDPSKVLAGFNISKTCERVSIFNPVLARYLTEKYLSEYDEVFDPFSGFSGRMLGVCASGKRYIGQDVNDDAVAESNAITNFLNLDAKLECKDVFESSGSYQCLITCPPYADKEVYSDEDTFLTCDQWIDLCLDRFDCERYVFVVGKTEKYADNVVETIGNKSHFSDSQESIVVL